MALESNCVQEKTLSKLTYPFTLQSVTQTNKICYIAQTMYTQLDIQEVKKQNVLRKERGGCCKHNSCRLLFCCKDFKLYCLLFAVTTVKHYLTLCCCGYSIMWYAKTFTLFSLTVSPIAYSDLTKVHTSVCACGPWLKVVSECTTEMYTRARPQHTQFWCKLYN